MNETRTIHAAIAMPYRVIEFEPTPNPNAMKCWLDRPVSERPLSFFNREMAADHPVAAALFSAGVTNVLLNGDWLTIHKPAETDWEQIKVRVERVLGGAL